MKMRPTPTNGKPSALDSANSIGEFPDRMDTVTADVLARLLRGERMTGMDGVFDAATTRLASFVNRLGRRYGWDIARKKKIVSTSDGRAAEVTEYYFDADTIRLARKSGASRYCKEVRSARAALRALA